MEPPAPPSAPVLALVRDLMFVSKITATARAEGVNVRVIRDPAGLPGQAGGRLVVDLNLPGAIPAAQSWREAEPHRRVIGFVSHVDAATISAARAAGVDQVFARSAFTERLAEILKA